MKLPAELKPENVTAICDTREQLPLDLSPLRVERGTLATGDYGLAAAPSLCAIERKSAEDMLACIGRERERFDREIHRLLAYPVRAVVVEAGWRFFEAGEWRGNITPNAAIGSLLGWIAAGVPIVMAYDHERAGRFVSRMLFTAARRRWREARALVTTITEQETAT
jgi:DNA excision repair protein ERCC-4